MLDSEGKGKAVRFIVRSLLHLMTQPLPTDELCGFSLFFSLSLFILYGLLLFSCRYLDRRAHSTRRVWYCQGEESEGICHAEWT